MRILLIILCLVWWEPSVAIEFNMRVVGCENYLLSTPHGSVEFTVNSRRYSNVFEYQFLTSDDRPRLSLTRDMDDPSIERVNFVLIGQVTYRQVADFMMANVGDAENYRFESTFLGADIVSHAPTILPSPEEEQHLRTIGLTPDQLQQPIYTLYRSEEQTHFAGDLHVIANIDPLIAGQVPNLFMIDFPSHQLLDLEFCMRLKAFIEASGDEFMIQNFQALLDEARYRLGVVAAAISSRKH